MVKPTALAERAAIVGVFEHPDRRIPDQHPFQVHTHCILAALADAGLSLDDVDGLCTAVADPPEGKTVFPVVELAEWLGIQPTYFDSTDLGGSAFLSHVGHAAAAIAAGRAEVVVVSYVGLPRSTIFDYGALRDDPSGAGFYESPYGLPLAGSFALLARRHMYERGTTHEQLAAVAVTCRHHAGPNPDARYREPISVVDVLASPMIADPLHRLDCCVVTDGGGALVLTSAARARDCAKRPAIILGHGESTEAFHLAERRSFSHTAATISGPRAFAEAGVTPADIDVAQLYDAYTITPLMALEDLGFCEPGESGVWAEQGELKLGGRLPINTDGGGLSSNHPGRRGMFLLIEAVRQLRGEGPGVQVEGAALALVHGIGGPGGASAVTTILGAG